MSLEKLREIEQAATPGPWAHVEPGQDGTIHRVRKVNDHDLPLFVCRMEDTGYSERSSWGQRGADAEFIATARNTYADLLDLAAAFVDVLSEVGVSELCSGLSITEYGCAGCPAHDAERALARLREVTP